MRAPTPGYNAYANRYNAYANRRGFGLDDALIQCGVFGPGVIETVLYGSHLVRALTVMLMVEDLIHKLEWQAFWSNKDKATYPVLEQMKEL
ncbi:hypothetical protein DPMN_081678 [Dreissena polymorpha]|uniref:Uncharacterized protein n=1 Tax=Dreissena polymorpha TaxID=45954 RepID=A0A9D4BI06_DREPO|nr:hypothetical protein DPMN_081678 [Dreissena polymorpha]